MIPDTILAIWNPTITLFKRFLALHKALEKEKAHTEVRMNLIANDLRIPIYGFNVQLFLNRWQALPEFLEGVRTGQGVAMVFFCPYFISERHSTYAIPMASTEHLALQLKGTVSNIKEIRRELSFYKYSERIAMPDDIILYLLKHYLEVERQSPVEAMKRVMRRLEGHFVLMALIAEGEWLMVGCRDEPLIIGEDNPTVYFGTDVETVSHFSSTISVISNETVLFCTTPYQLDAPTPMIIE